MALIHQRMASLLALNTAERIVAMTQVFARLVGYGVALVRHERVARAVSCRTR